MERLSFDEKSRYDGLEASIHVARYLLARTFCSGRSVLDIACGEGYGSRLLKEWGATEVCGVDISEEAVARARGQFGHEGIEFHCSSAENLPELLGDQRFDLIVSLETIEHLQDPEAFLRHLRGFLSPGGCIIISCPNDWWYFPKEEERNPYHLRKYHFEEFQRQTEKVLGKASAWLLGAPTFGFLNTIRTSCPQAQENAGQLTMMQTQGLDAVHMVPAEFGAGPRDQNASYFVGIWCDEPMSIPQTAALLPLSMDAFRKGIFQGHFSSQQELLRMRFEQMLSENERLRTTLEQMSGDSRAKFDGAIEKEHRNLRLRLQVALAENQLMRDTVHQLRAELALYRRFKKMVPVPLRSVLNKVRNLVRKVRA